LDADDRDLGCDAPWSALAVMALRKLKGLHPMAIALEKLWCLPPPNACRAAACKRSDTRSVRIGTGIWLSVLALAGTGLSTESRAAGWNDAALPRLRDLGAPGVVLAWTDGLGTSHIRSTGVASLAGPMSVDRHTVFHMASVTKPLVATAIMQLAEDGRVDLEASPMRYIPYLRINDPRAGEITIRQMLNHSSGLPDIRDYQWDKPQTDDGALERWVRGLSDIQLVSTPGTAFHYSNLAYDLLADVIAKVSGMPFETYIQRRILAPLGMSHSSLLLGKVDRRQLAAPHILDEGRTKISPVFPYNRVHAGSSTLYSDAADMLRWARYWAKSDARLLSSRSIAAMLRPTIEIDRPDRKQWKPAMGLGWFLLTVEGHGIVYHMGQDVGFTTGLMAEPGTGRAVVVMSNIATDDTSERVFDLCLHQILAMRAGRPRSALDPKPALMRK
jgi:CubicO group peptidase (beta-lactamase class C family)